MAGKPSQPRLRKRRSLTTSTLSLGSVGAILLLIAPIAMGYTVFYSYPPYNSGFASLAKAGGGCGSNGVPYSPTADPHSGDVNVSIGAFALGCGAYKTDSIQGFWGPTGTPSWNGLHNISYQWIAWWQAGIGTSLCALGASWAEVAIVIHGNLRDVTTSSWALGNDATLTLWNASWGCGLSWSVNHILPVTYDLTFTAYLYNTQVYQYYTYIYIHTLAGAVGFADASSAVNIAPPNYGAICNYMSEVYV